MALTYDNSRILSQLDILRERSIYTARDTFVEQLYTESPVNFDAFVFQSWTLETLDESGRQRNSQTKQLPELENQNLRKEKVKIKTFEIQSEPFQFDKQDVEPKENTNVESNLTQLLQEKIEFPTRLGNSMSSFETNIKLLLNVYLPNGKSIKMKVWGKNTVEFVIEQSLRQMLDMESTDINKPPVPTLSDPKGYLLRVAEDDGTPDEDIPALVRTQEIGKIRGSVVFALCLDFKYKPEEVQRALMRTFKVYVSGADYVSVLLKEKMTLRELREYVCVKKRIPPEIYGFLLTKDMDELRFNFLPIDMTCGEISDKELVDGIHLTNRKERLGLSHRSSSRNLSVSLIEKGDAPNTIEKRLGPMFFLTPAVATKYQQFVVFKGNKFGSRQQRLMGIDAERITNSIPDNKKGTSAKKPVRSIKDIVKASLIPNKPRYFTLEYKDKTYKYESNQAEEIIAKITYLIGLQKIRSNEMDPS